MVCLYYALSVHFVTTLIFLPTPLVPIASHSFYSNCSIHSYYCLKQLIDLLSEDPMNYTSCPPVVVASQYNQDLLHYDHVLKILSSTIMLLLAFPVTLINFLVIWTIIKSPSMQTPSFILICSLALTDFISGFITIPINASWRIVEFLNPDANVCSTFDIGFAIAFTLLSASELTVTALSIDRYLAIRLSNRYRQRVTNGRAVKLVVVLWCIATIWGVSSVFVTPRVLHITVVVVGVITFGIIFVCYSLAFRALLGQEASARVLNSRLNCSAGLQTLCRQETSSSISNTADLQVLRVQDTTSSALKRQLNCTADPQALRGQETKLRALNTQASPTAAGQTTLIFRKQLPQQLISEFPSHEAMLGEKSKCFHAEKTNFPSQKALSLTEANVVPVTTKKEIRNPSLPQSEVVEYKIHTSEVVGLEFEKSHKGICGFPYCRKYAPPLDKDKSAAKHTDNNRDQQKETVSPLSTEIRSAKSKNISVHGSHEISSFKDLINGKAFNKIQNQSFLEKKIHYLRSKVKILKSGAETSVRLVKYRHTIVTLLWVIAMLILSYAPYFFLSFVVMFIGMTNEVAVAWSITITLLCTNSLINPVVYLWRLKGLRKACWKILKGTRCLSDGS